MFIISVTKMNFNKTLINFLISAALLLFFWFSLNLNSEALFIFVLLPFCWLAIASGILAVTMRLVREKINKTSLLYTFLGCFNIAIGIALIFGAIKDKFKYGNYLLLFIIPLFVGLFILGDILFQKNVK